MNGTTLTRAQLSEALCRQMGFSRHDSSVLLESILEEISQAFERGDTVKLPTFGSFSVCNKRERIGRNPRSGEEVPIPPRNVLVFRASRLLKDRINKSLLGNDQ